MPILLDLPTDTRDIVKLADWMEVNTLADTDNNTSRPELVGILSNGSETEEDQIQDSESELTAQSVMTEIEQRIIAAGEGYPFILEGDLLKQKPQETRHTAYKFCLLISFLGVTDSHLTLSLGDVTKNFEELSAHVLESYLSNDNMQIKTRVFGYPRNDASSFETAVDDIAKEFKALKREDRGGSKHIKDAGLDIIGWNMFPDELPGFLFLGQCATGANWQEKLYDISKFTDVYVRVDVSHMKGLFVPHMIQTTSTNNVEDWKVLTAQAGGIFDRCRIAHLAISWSPDHINTFITDTIAAIRAN